MPKRLLIAQIITSIWFLVGAREANAFSFEIDNVSSTSVSTANDEVEVNLVWESLPSDSYFRVAFQAESGGVYFGEVKVGDHWVTIETLTNDRNGHCQNYVLVSNVETGVQMTLKVGKDDLESGKYNIKAHRFTQTCKSYAASTNSVQIESYFPTPTPEPTPEPTAKPTQKPTKKPRPTPKATAGKATVKPTVKAKATKKPTKKPEAEKEDRRASARDDDRVEEAGLSSSQDSLQPGEEVLGDKDRKRFPWVAGLFVLAGVGLVGVGAYPFYMPYLKKYVLEKYNLGIGKKEETED